MNSMTEPTNSGDRINDSKPGYAEGLVEGYARGLGYAPRADGPDDGGFAERFLRRQRARVLPTPVVPVFCVVDDAGFCTTHEGVHPSVEDLAAMRRDDCPDWCRFDHREDDERDDLISHLSDENTDGTVRRLLDAAKLDIRLARTDCPDEGTVGAPNLYVRVDAELTTWEQAAELARTILDSFGYLGNVEA